MTIVHGGTPDLPGFDRVAGICSGADWCRFVDSDARSEPRYLSDGNGAFLVAHHCPGEPEPHYPAGLVLGGRAGRVSRLLLDDGASPEQLPALIDAAVEMFPSSCGGWSWPFLTGDDSRRLIRALGVGASGLRLAGADCTVEVTGGGVEAHVATSLQSRERRADVREELASFSRGRVRVTATSAASGDCPSPELLGPLLATVERAHGRSVTDAGAIDLLHRRNRFLADSSTVFTATDPGGRITGFSVLRRVGDEATVDVVGLRDPSRDSVTGPLHAHLALWEPLAWCAGPGRGVRTLHLGMQAFEAKTRRGAAMRSLWTVTVPARVS
ncbi:hypothetical protein [Corynebacterium pygosceleis]|uniref:BioF2-like acetyltransferase domain-containing protein n=1 Tax=Corynebacterium pygosceleis TaxID=2800406 RepID=A0A9Q4C8L5_9CORY|nr:hypothetical protein [Corynebacterium pygosceleis]MCK7637821.1 hypothetical protein [Corynebacterium pygosceleis]MCK7675535.1 hypothetical protein [Corynebacterium pygosceleis]MCL0121071.1 hypothetical protein [Corynebacterium pygosceleis]MCX7444639.1 hypothetical protein [Corynebacterium pygosceleis]MCX7468537.1 hypothetical protein [Corynebacterium pygosceleis]